MNPSTAGLGGAEFCGGGWRLLHLSISWTKAFAHECGELVATGIQQSSSYIRWSGHKIVSPLAVQSLPCLSDMSDKDLKSVKSSLELFTDVAFICQIICVIMVWSV